MMKKTIFLFILLLCLSINAQQKLHVDITWEEVTVATSKSTFTIPGFDKEFFDYSEDKGVQYVLQWNESGLINETSIRLMNVSYETITKQQLKDLELNLIPKAISFEGRTITARGKNKGYISFSPIIKEGNQYKRIQSVDILYDTSQQLSVKSAAKIAVTNSVLATGNWHKFYVDKTGVFRITASFLNDIGVDLNGVNPQTIKIYGNGGAMLPLRNSENTEFDLRENAIQIVGGEDGVFSGDDYILLYGEGTLGYNEESETNINAYSDRSYYYVTTGGANGRRITPYVEPSGTATTIINTFTDYQFHEMDDFNLVTVGRRWFGDRFDIEANKSFEFNFPNIVTTTPVELRVFAAATAESSTTMNIRVNSQNISTLSFSPINSTSLASGRNITRDVTLTDEKVTVDLSYNNNGNPTATGYLDFISIEAERQLIAANEQFSFRNNNVATISGIGQYQMSNTAEIEQIWEVTNPASISTIINQGGQSTINFKANLGQLREYVAITANNYFEPLSDGNTTVSNQDIKGTIFLDNQGQFLDVDYLLITRNDLLASANRLAEYHRSTNGLNVKVLKLSDIYNEFSSGKQDIGAIRNLVKYVYDNASEPSKRLRYLCLLGDSSVDYKDRLDGNNNIVPTFHNLLSFSLVSSFASDDFYGMMDPNEGTMTNSDQLDIAIGRILADTPRLADQMIDKILNYENELAKGRWRNNVVLVSDDVDQAWEETIQRNLDELGEDLNTRKPFLNIEKIYADTFQQESSAAGNRYPRVNEAISNAIEAGSLVVDYFGHGGEDGLASEFIFNQTNARELNNENRFPVIITVTCEFTKFDNPLRPSAGEFVYWNTDGGAVGLITTTREVIVNFGITVNDRLSEFLFPDGNTYPTIAEAVRLTKNTFTVRDRRAVFFFGDPAMKLAIPRPNVRLTHVNDVAIGNALPTLEALSRVKISGEVVTESGTLISDYNGILATTIYDKEVNRETLGNDGVVTSGTNQLITLNFRALGEIIFRGQASVTNGKFDVEFIVPRDIAIPVGQGRISFYASKNGSLENQTGVNKDIEIGGINENAPEDNIGPAIQLFLNDESFVSGSTTNNSPILIAKLQDASGINTASGIGHDIVAILDGDETNPFILNDFYETEVDDFTRGIVNFKLRDIEPGLHTLSVKGWDVYNNSGTQEIQFVVADGQGLVLENVLNYPNPFINYTEFWFTHNSPINDILEVQIQVFTVSGKVVWTKNQTLSGKSTYREDIQWDGRDDFGDRIGKGVYVYKISVKSTLTNQRIEKFEKLVIL